MWQELFKKNNIEILNDFESESVDKPSNDDLELVEQKLSIKLPIDYRNFCLELGPGMIADWIRIFAPCEENLYVDLYSQIESGWQTFDSEAEDIPNEFKKEKMISFSTTDNGDTFYWKIDEPTDGGNFAIYGLTHTLPASIIKVADNFHDFIMEAGFGNRLIDVDMYGSFRSEMPRNFMPAPKDDVDEDDFFEE